MSHIAVFPGSYDPITLGHTDIIDRSLSLFDKIIVAIGENSAKQYLFPLEKRIEWIEKIYKDEEKVEVKSYKGLTVDFCHDVGASYIIRGIRSSNDSEYERTIAQLNKSLAADIETICLICRPELSHISSSIVREIIRNKGDYKVFVPKEVVV